MGKSQTLLHRAEKEGDSGPGLAGGSDVWVQHGFSRGRGHETRDNQKPAQWVGTGEGPRGGVPCRQQRARRRQARSGVSRIELASRARAPSAGGRSWKPGPAAAIGESSSISPAGLHPEFRRNLGSRPGIIDPRPETAGSGLNFHSSQFT